MERSNQGYGSDKSGCGLPQGYAAGFQQRSLLQNREAVSDKPALKAPAIVRLFAGLATDGLVARYPVERIARDRFSLIILQLSDF